MSIFKISYFCLAYLRHDVITARLDRWRAPVRNYVMCFKKRSFLILLYYTSYRVSAKQNAQNALPYESKFCLIR